MTRCTGTSGLIFCGSPPSCAHRVAHRREIDDRGNAGEVLHQHPRRAVLDLAVDPPLFQPVGHRLEIVAGDGLAVLESQQVLQQHLHREGQARHVAKRLARLAAANNKRSSCRRRRGSSGCWRLSWPVGIIAVFRMWALRAMLPENGMAPLATPDAPANRRSRRTFPCARMNDRRAGLRAHPYIRLESAINMLNGKAGKSSDKGQRLFPPPCRRSARGRFSRRTSERAAIAGELALAYAALARRRAAAAAEVAEDRRPCRRSTRSARSSRAS